MNEKQRSTFNFEDLLIYQKALDYLDFVYELTSTFPREELYGLTSQFQRAAQSIVLNIAEGSGGSKTEFKRFIGISRRSDWECVACTAIAKRRGYIDSNNELKSREMAAEISKMLSGLHNSLE